MPLLPILILASLSILRKLSLNLPVLSVTPSVFKKAAPLTLKPFSFANTKLAFFQKLLKFH